MVEAQRTERMGMKRQDESGAEFSRDAIAERFALPRPDRLLRARLFPERMGARIEKVMQCDAFDAFRSTAFSCRKPGPDACFAHSNVLHLTLHHPKKIKK